MVLKILPGKISGDASAVDSYNEAYQFWKRFWTDEMAKSGGDHRYVDADDFLRQNEILVVTEGDQIISMVMSTVYDLSIPSERDSKYFSKVDAPVIKKIMDSGSVISTIEFLAVNPDWRGAKPGAPMSAVMIGLALQRGAALGAHACVGMPRVDNRVNVTAQGFGAHALGRVVKVNIECEIVAFYPDKITTHPNPHVNALVNRLITNVVFETHTKSKSAKQAA